MEPLSHDRKCERFWTLPGAQLSLMLDHAAHPRWAALRDVPDPYYGGQDGFAEVFEMLSDAAAGFLKRL